MFAHLMRPFGLHICQAAVCAEPTKLGLQAERKQSGRMMDDLMPELVDLVLGFVWNKLPPADIGDARPSQRWCAGSSAAPGTSSSSYEPEQ